MSLEVSKSENLEGFSLSLTFFGSDYHFYHNGRWPRITYHVSSVQRLWYTLTKCSIAIVLGEKLQLMAIPQFKIKAEKTILEKDLIRNEQKTNLVALSNKQGMN